MSESPIVQRLHITFGKSGMLKYTGNLDIAKVWERVLRRAQLPILYTQGFNTRPRISLAVPLPLGMTSECEILDVSLKEEIDITGLAEKLLAVSPDGLTIQHIEVVPPNAPSLQPLIHSADYRITFVDPVDIQLVESSVDTFLARDQIPVIEMKRGKKSAYDIRSLVHSMVVETGPSIVAHLAVGNRGNLRPDDLLKHLHLDQYHTNIHRTRLHITK